MMMMRMRMRMRRRRKRRNKIVSNHFLFGMFGQSPFLSKSSRTVPAALSVGGFSVMTGRRRIVKPRRNDTITARIRNLTALYVDPELLVFVAEITVMYDTALSLSILMALLSLGEYTGKYPQVIPESK